VKVEILLMLYKEYKNILKAVEKGGGGKGIRESNGRG
jgi:hypothetical protein